MNVPPRILPVSSETKRPLWSVMIPVYNAMGFLAETLQSVLMQDPGRETMQIHVVDDASTDADVKSLVEKLAGDRVEYFRQPQNVGSLKNFETSLNLSRGHLVHLLHADDRVRDGYYLKMASLFERHPEIGAAFCRYDTVNEEGRVLGSHYKEMEEEGILEDWFMKIAKRQRLQVCTITVKRSVYEHLGGFYGVSYGEDWEMWARIARHYKVGYTPGLLADYRMHTASISGKSYKSAQNIRDIKWVIDAILEMVPVDQQDAVRRAANQHYAHYAMLIANQIWHQTHDKAATRLQIREAMKMHKDALMLFRSAKIHTKMLINRV